SMGHFGKDVDDGLAVILAVNSPELEVQGITKVFGNATLHDVDSSLDVLLEKWENSAADRKITFPTANGADKPLHKFPHEIQDYFMKDGVISYEEFISKDVVQSIKTGERYPAIHLLAEKIHELPGQIVVVPIGPLTNIALLYAIYPELLAETKLLSIMGGKLNGWEFNFANDPIATHYVLTSNIKKKISGLEVCTAQQFGKKHFKMLKAHNTKLSDYISNNIKSWLALNRLYQFWRPNTGFYPFDACALINLIHPGCITYKEVCVKQMFPKHLWHKFNFFIKTREINNEILNRDKMRNQDRSRDNVPRKNFEEFKEFKERRISKNVKWATSIHSALLMEILLERLK
ncbi:MAG: hypothetical protein GF364_11280, partial [Candidatus Lokiarchaeota archaeon]|nr:hypothetical protein [Candidatus Lokiarchaeota archaeon]